MKKIVAGLLLVLCYNFVFISQVEAGAFFGGEIEKNPSVFSYGWKGCFVGMLAGLSTGYLAIVDRDDSDEEDLKTGLRHLGYGAIGGTVLGLAVGSYELTQDYTGTGAVVLRDMQSGALMGGIMGLAGGLISYGSSNNSDDIGRGAAWGNLGGILLGGVYGFIEAPRVLGIAKSSPGWMPYASVKICKDEEKSYPFYAVSFTPVRF